MDPPHRVKPRFSVSTCFLLAILCSLPVRATGADAIRIGGTGSALGSIRIIAAAFEKERGTKITIAPSMGSSGGIKAVADNALDIALSSRPLKDDERRQGLSELEYAKTLYVPISHPSVPVEDLSRADIIGALIGTLVTWPNGERIRFVLRPESDTDSQMLRALSPEVSRAVDRARSHEGMLIALTDQNNADMIEKIPGAVGFSSLGLVRAEQRKVKVLALDGIQPDTEAYRSGAYGPVKSLYLTTRSDAQADVKAFVQFLLSPRGRQVLERTGNMPAQAVPAPR